jgi:uncharacterized protein GlcG (DUF336 family)
VLLTFDKDFAGEREVLGACEASGDTADSDEACVVAAIESVGLIALPGNPH